MTLNSELITRFKSAIVLVVGALALTLLHPLTFAAMILVGAGILWKEWFALTKGRSIGWFFFGLVYILAAVLSLIYLRNANLMILLSLFAIVWGADIAGYLVGREYGKHKIAPSISPGKSWEGLAGSVVVGASIGAIFGYMAPIVHAILGAALAVIGLGGDMFESWMKRRAGVKDSGTLIPGHGGVFDRVDALLPCAIVAALAFMARNGSM
jgi:phosphatidate cytidylyltransferase